jgi:hypothetical protein
MAYAAARQLSDFATTNIYSNIVCEEIEMQHMRAKLICVENSCNSLDVKELRSSLVLQMECLYLYRHKHTPSERPVHAGYQ